MLQSLIKFFIGLGLTAALATTVATTVYSYYQQYGTSEGTGWMVPNSVTAVPEIGADHLAGAGVLLLGAICLISHRGGKRRVVP